MLDRWWRATVRHGPRAASRRLVQIVRGRLYLREEHVWYELPLGTERAARPLPEGLVLVEADDVQTRLLDDLPTMAPPEALKLRERGGRLYLVLEGARPLFACWIHASATPAIAAPGGWLQLPVGTVCLEDSVTAAAARGRGVAPAAWSELADRLAADGVERMITKVGVENAPSRKAVEKAGFREAAVMRLTRIGPRARVSVEGDSELAGELRRRLGLRP